MEYVAGCVWIEGLNLWCCKRSATPKAADRSVGSFGKTLSLDLFPRPVRNSIAHLYPLPNYIT